MNKNQLYLRKATMDDADILFEWVNDKITRQSAFDSHIISYDEHIAWFSKLLNDTERAQYILMLDDKPLGQIRLDIEGVIAEIDYSICRSERGKGYGNVMIELIKKQVHTDFPLVRRLIGRVKPSNKASYNCFISNGFEETFRQMEFVLER